MSTTHACKAFTTSYRMPPLNYHEMKGATSHIFEDVVAYRKWKENQEPACMSSRMNSHSLHDLGVFVGRRQHCVFLHRIHYNVPCCDLQWSLWHRGAFFRGFPAWTGHHIAFRRMIHNQIHRIPANRAPGLAFWGIRATRLRFEGVVCKWIIWHAVKAACRVLYHGKR